MSGNANEGVLFPVMTGHRGRVALMAAVGAVAVLLLTGCPQGKAGNPPTTSPKSPPVATARDAGVPSDVAPALPVAIVNENPPPASDPAGAIIWPLPDQDHEYLLVPKEEVMKAHGWDREELQESLGIWWILEGSRTVVRDPSDVKVVPRNRSRHTSLDAVPLDFLAEVTRRPLTFVPVEQLKPLAEVLFTKSNSAARALFVLKTQLRGRARYLPSLMTPFIRAPADGFQAGNRMRDILECLGKHGASVVPDLLDRLKRQSYTESAVDSLVFIGAPAVPPLREFVLQTPANPRGTKRAATLKTPDGKSLEVLFQRTAASAEAAKALARIRPEGVTVLLDLMKTGSADVRTCVAIAVKSVITPEAVPALIEALGNPEPSVRVAAAEALSRQGLAAREALPALIGLLGESHDSETRVAAIDTLGRLRLDARRVVSALIPLLVLPTKGQDDEQLRTALFALSRLGPEAEASLPLIVTMLRDLPLECRKAAMVALANIGGPGAAAALPEVRPLLKPGSEWLSYALRAVRGMGPDGAPALPELRSLVRGELPPEVVDALVGIGAPAAAAIPDLMPFLAKQTYGGDADDSLIRMLAAIDLDGAVEAIRADQQQFPLRAKNLKVTDLRPSALRKLAEFREKAERLKAAIRPGGRVGYPQIEIGHGKIADFRQTLRPGDSLERVVALIGTPICTVPGLLFYNETYGIDPGYPCFVLVIRMRDGRIESLSWEERTEPIRRK